MTGLEARQQDSAAIDVLAASRVLYRRSKVVRAFRLVGDGGAFVYVLLMSFFGAPTDPIFTAGVVAYGAFARLVLLPTEQRARRDGADLHEVFERFVLGLTPAIDLSYATLLREDVVTLAHRYDMAARWRPWLPWHRLARTPPGRSPLENWFVARSAVPDDVAAVIAQRSSAAYPVPMGRAWFITCVSVAVVGLTAAIGVALYRQSTTSTLLLSLVVPGVPAMLDAVEGAVAVAKANAARQSVVQACEVWLAHRVGDREDLLRKNLRAATLWRTQSPGIPDLVYWLMRSHSEARMRAVGACM